MDKVLVKIQDGFATGLYDSCVLIPSEYVHFGKLTKYVTISKDYPHYKELGLRETTLCSIVPDNYVETELLNRLAEKQVLQNKIKKTECSINAIERYLNEINTKKYQDEN